MMLAQINPIGVLLAVTTVSFLVVAMLYLAHEGGKRSLQHEALKRGLAHIVMVPDGYDKMGRRLPDKEKFEWLPGTYPAADTDRIDWLAKHWIEVRANHRRGGSLSVFADGPGVDDERFDIRKHIDRYKT